MFGARLRLAPSVRVALERRSAGACERCHLEWRWTLYVFKVDEAAPCTASNLIVLCGACSADREGDFTPLVGERSTRERMLAASNRRAGAEPLTASRRRALIAERGGACEICGISGTGTVLQVHHRMAVLRGGSDRPENLLVVCFACHHQLRPCATGCGAWAGRRFAICHNCRMRRALEELIPGATWEEIKSRFPGFVAQWKPGYEPLPVPPTITAVLR